MKTLSTRTMTRLALSLAAYDGPLWPVRPYQTPTTLET